MGQEPESEVPHRRGFLARVYLPTGRGLPPKRRYLLMLTILLAIVLIIGFIGISSIRTSQSKTMTPYTLAISTALSGPQEEAGQEALQGVRLYLNSINRAGGVNGHPLNLLVFNDRANPTTAVQVAHQVVASPALLLLGPLYNTVALPTNPIYKNAHLPAISASVSNDSITSSNPFFFRLGTTTTEEASTSATYVLKILGFHTASIVYTDDTGYGIPTAKGFASTFSRGGGVVQSLRLAEDPAQRQQTLHTIVTTLAHESGPRMIFLAMLVLDTDARQVIVALRRQGITTPLMSTDSPGSDSFAAAFSSYPEERSQPGYFTDGLYASSPLLYDSAPAAVQSFAAQYQQTYESAPGWHAAKYYEAAQVAVAALQAATLKDTSASVYGDRLQVAKQLEAIHSPQTAVDGLDGFLYFDSTHNSVAPPIRFGQFSHDQFLSAPLQIVAVSNPDLVDLANAERAGDIIQVGKQYDWKQSVVYAGIDLKEVSAIDVTDSTFTADFYLWLRYTGTENATAITFPNASSVTFDPSAPVTNQTIDGLHYRLYHVRGDFRADYDFHDYPFDQQQLIISFQNTLLTADRLVYVIDTQGLQLGQSTTTVDTTAAFQLLTSWTYISTGYASDTFTNRSTLGNPQLFNTQVRTDYSGLEMTITIQRKVLPYLISHLLPQVLLFLLVYASLFLSTKHLGDRLVLIVTALLTSAVLLLSVNSELPAIGYVVSLSYIYYIFFAICLLCMIAALLMERMEERGKHVAVFRMNIALHITYLAIVAAVVISYLVVYSNRFL
ncbi:MAG TPA: ABC transporter substrate-binding protein [Ktedonobacteraceae bacterium]|nr:ABC transporter substrate-binding protein [Ktedonobacteraceae bacterium]